MESSPAHEVFEEDGAYVSGCLYPDIARDGAAHEEAFANLREALALGFEPIAKSRSTFTQEKS